MSCGVKPSQGQEPAWCSARWQMMRTLGRPHSPNSTACGAFSKQLARSTSCPAQLCSTRASSMQSLSSRGVSSLTSVQGSLPKLRTCAAPAAVTAESEDLEETEAKSSEYSDTMQQRMGGYLTYCHEDGINYADILEDVMVGSCLQTPEDVDRCAVRGHPLPETMGMCRLSEVQQQLNPAQTAVSHTVDAADAVGCPACLVESSAVCLLPGKLGVICTGWQTRRAWGPS